MGQQMFRRFRGYLENQTIPVTCTQYSSVLELDCQNPAEYDLEILFTPPALADSKSDYDYLETLYQVPKEFSKEWNSGLTHSVGSHIGHDGTETLWLRFLVEVPSEESASNQPEWLKSSCVLRWTTKASTVASTARFKVTVVVFQPTEQLIQSLAEWLKSQQWVRVTQDPYVLVDILFASWHERIDRSAWLVNDRGRSIEEQVFATSKGNDISAIDLRLFHTVAKTAIFMIEGLDAALRALDIAIANHGDVGDQTSSCWKQVHKSLRYRAELFQSTRLRTISAQARIKNIIDLTFHIESAKDSRSMRILSILGSIFIPFSAICSIFGTQFFTSVTNQGSMQVDNSSSVSVEGTSYMDVNPQFWVLWAIALPVSLTIILSWYVWENWRYLRIVWACQVRRLQRKIKSHKDDMESGELSEFVRT